MPASVPVTVMPLTLTGFAVPTFLLLNDALVDAVVNTSPAKRLSDSVTVALVVASYTLFWPAALTVRPNLVMSAVVLAVVADSV